MNERPVGDDDGGADQLDRGPATTDPDGPRSARGLWRLMRLAGIDAVRAVRLAEAFASWPSLAHATTAQLARLGAAGVADRVRHVPEGELPRTIDGDVVSIFEPAYPPWLADVPNPPPLLWVEGALPASSGIAVVGTRFPTEFGLRVARRAAQEAVAAGHPVVSGMADGVDRAAEAAAAEAAGVVVSVLGGGLDRVPPALAEHRDRVLSEGGAVVSEHPPGVEATRPTLTARNRIQVGLAHAVVVCQGTPGSSTAATARFALVQGRTLVVPRPPAGSAHAAAAQSALLLALTDEGGCDPQVLGITGRHAAVIANRRPVADVVVADGDALADAVRRGQPITTSATTGRWSLGHSPPGRDVST